MTQLSDKSSSSSSSPAMDLSTATWRESREESLGLTETESKGRGPLKDHSIARILNLGSRREDSSPTKSDGRDALVTASRHPKARLLGQSDPVDLETVPFPLPSFRPVHPRPSTASYRLTPPDDPLLFKSISPLSLYQREYFHRSPFVSSADFTRFGMKPRAFSNLDSSKVFFRRGALASSCGYDVLGRTSLADECLLRPQDFSLPHPFGSSALAVTPPPKLSPTDPEWKRPPPMQDQDREHRHCRDAESPMPVLKAEEVPSRVQDSDSDTVDEDGNRCRSPEEEVEGHAVKGKKGESKMTDESSRGDRVSLKRRLSHEDEVEESFPVRWKDEFSLGQRSMTGKTPSPEFPSDESGITSTTAEINNNTIETPLLDGSKMAAEGTKHGEEIASRLIRLSAEEGIPRKKRIRTSFSQTQLHAMETLFRRSHYPDVETRTQLGRDVGLDENKIQIWFQNRRAKWRKLHKLSRFGGLQDITATDYVPAPTTAVHTSSDLTCRLADQSKLPLPRGLDQLLPFPPSTLDPLRPLTSSPMDPLTSRVHPGVFHPSLGHSVTLPLTPYSHPRVPDPAFFPSLLMCQAFETTFSEAQGSNRRQISRVTRPDLDLGPDRVKDAPRSRLEAGAEVTVHDV